MHAKSSGNRSSKFTWLLIILGIPVLLIAIMAAVVVIGNKPPQLPKDNAWDDFVRAGNMIKSAGHPGPISSTRPVSSWTIPEYEAFIKANEPALDVVREALQKQYLAPQPKDTADVHMDEFAYFREIGRTLLGEAKYYETVGDYRKAMDSRLDCVELGVTIPCGGSVLAALVGSAVESIGLSEVHPLLTKLTERDLTRMASHLERVKSKRVPYSATLREESRVRSLVDIAKDPLYLRRLAKEQEGHYTGKSTLKPISPVALPEVVMLSRCTVVHRESIIELLQTEVALRRYHFDHGSYPTSLKALAPKYLKKTPIDPFGLGKPLRYKPLNNGKDFLLYSLGPNLKDDGGVQGKWQGDKTKGDMVAGKW